MANMAQLAQLGLPVPVKGKTMLRNEYIPEDDRDDAECEMCGEVCRLTWFSDWLSEAFGPVSGEYADDGELPPSQDYLGCDECHEGNVEADQDCAAESRAERSFVSYER